MLRNDTNKIKRSQHYSTGIILFISSESSPTETVMTGTLKNSEHNETFIVTVGSNCRVLVRS